MKEENISFLEIIGLGTVLFGLIFFIYIQFRKADCVEKGYSSADIDGCFIQMNNQRIRNITN